MHYLVIDTEVLGLDARYDASVPFHFATVATSCKDGRVVELSELQSVINAALSDGRRLVFHNASFDVGVLRTRGIDIPPDSYDDTMLMSYVLEPSGEHSLAEWGFKLGLEKLDIGKQFDVRTDVMEQYAIRDANLTALLYEHLVGELSDDAKYFYGNLVLPYVEVIIEMEETGLYIDRQRLPQVRAYFQNLMDTEQSNLNELIPYVPGNIYEYGKGYHRTTVSYDKAVELLGEYLPTNAAHPNPRTSKGVQVTLYPRCNIEWGKFNPKSADDIAWALTTKYKWQPTEVSDKTGKPLTNAAVLAELPYAEVDHIEGYSKAHTMESTFLRAWDVYGDEYGRVHAGYNQAVTLTGRLSSSNPNNQNIPRKGEAGDILRSLVITPNEDVLMFGGDLSNIEPRMLAHYLVEYTGYEGLAEVFRRGEDFHTFNAQEWRLTDLATDLLHNVYPPEKIRSVARDMSKVGLLASIYGSGAAMVARGASRGLPIRLTTEQGRDILDSIKHYMPQLFELKELIWEEARSNDGHVQTWFGRDLYYPYINSRRRDVRGRAERQVFNAILQGSSADLIQLGMLNAHPIVHEHDGVYAATVHDEVLGYVMKATSDGLAAKLTDEFSKLSQYLHVPVVAQFSVGTSWSSIH